MGADKTRKCGMSSLSISKRRSSAVNTRFRLSIQVVFIFTNPAIVVVTSPGSSEQNVGFVKIIGYYINHSKSSIK